MESELSRSHVASTIRDGVKVALLGLPNTGKSSLLNALARRDAAIVSSIPGTTRDVIEVQLDIEGVPVILSDTAGLRISGDEIEQEGIRRSLAVMEEADVTIWVAASDVHSSTSIWPDVHADILVLNKSDLQRGAVPSPWIDASAKLANGEARLLSELGKLVRERYVAVGHSAVSTVRQSSALRDSIRALNDCLGLECPRPELMAYQLQRAADGVGRITGRVDVEEWLGEIFSRFCIGK